jgi:hypothetical protein
LKSNKSSGRRRRVVKYAIFSGLITFLIACAMNINSQFFLTEMKSVSISLFLLLAVILVGIIFDIIGVAVAVANPASFNASSARKIPGSTQALRLINNSSRVANICCDMMGDICGTVSGGMGVGIIILLPWAKDPQQAIIATMLMSGMVAAITVGGKALSKDYSINKADKVMLMVGRFIAFFEEIFISQKKRSQGWGTQGKNNEKGKGR